MLALPLLEQDKHDKILLTAKRIIEDHDEISLRKVAKMAGVSLGTVNYYFQNKQGLVDALQKQFLQEFNEFAKRAMQTAQQSSEPIKTFENIMREMIRWVRTNRALVRIRALEKVRIGRHSQVIASSNAQALILATKAIVSHSPRSEEEIRACLFLLTNSIGKNAALDAPDETAKMVGAPVEQALSLCEDIWVESAIGFLFPNRPT